MPAPKTPTTRACLPDDGLDCLFPQDRFMRVDIPKRTAEKSLSELPGFSINPLMNNHDQFHTGSLSGNSTHLHMVECMLFMENDDAKQKKTSRKYLNADKSLALSKYGPAMCSGDVASRYVQSSFNASDRMVYVVGRLQDVFHDRKVRTENDGSIVPVDVSTRRSTRSAALTKPIHTVRQRNPNPSNSANPLGSYFILGMCALKDNGLPQVRAHKLTPEMKSRLDGDAEGIVDDPSFPTDYKGAKVAYVSLICSNFSFGKIMIDHVHKYYESKGYDAICLSSVENAYGFYTDKVGYRIHDPVSHKTFPVARNKSRAAKFQKVFTTDSKQNGYFLMRPFNKSTHSTRHIHPLNGSLVVSKHAIKATLPIKKTIKSELKGEVTPARSTRITRSSAVAR